MPANMLAVHAPTPCRSAQGQGFFAVAGFANDLQILFELKHLADPATHHRVIVDQ